MSAAARIFNYSKDSISNHTNPYEEYGFLPDHYVESQKLSPPEKLALIVHISDCYNARLLFNPKLFRTFANNIIEMKSGIQWVGKS